ncbi:MAG: outer membrane protein assembly factor BamA [bacterium]
MSLLRQTILLGVALWVAVALGANAEVIKDVKVRSLGTVAVDEALVRSYVSAHKGQELDRGVVSGDVRALLASGRFSDASAGVEPVDGGVVLSYAVKMKVKLIQPVRVVGAEELSENKVRDLIGLNPGDFLDDATVAARVVKVREEYRKLLYGFVTVKWSLDVTDEKAGLALLTVKINEGTPQSVREIRFPGAKAVEYSALREAMNLPAWWNPIGWFQKTPYDTEELKAGCERIRAVYKDRGYLDVEIPPPLIEETSPGKFRVTARVVEGVCYHVARVTLSGSSMFPETALLAAANLKSGAVASSTSINQAAEAIRDYYESRGYMDTLVGPRLDLKAKVGDVDIRFVVSEGRLTYIRNVLIRGNSVTQDKVIRRELLVYPGEKFDGVRIRKSENILRNMGYFANVTSFDEGGSASNRSDIVFEVEEQRTGQFMAGAGFSSIDKLIGFFEVSQGNFDIRGRPFMGAGEKIKLRTEFGSTRESYSLSFVEPWFLDHKLSLSTDLYRQRVNDRDYDTQRQGGSLGLGVPLGGPNRLDIKYRLEQVSIRDVSDTNAFIVVNGGETNTFDFTEPERVASSVALTLSRDTRDNFFVPTRGARTYATGTLMGGPFGFDTSLYDLELGSTVHVPLWWHHVLSLRGRAEVVDSYGDTEEVPLSERMYMGGSRTVRGFRYRWVGPKAERADGSGTIRPCGGQSLALASAEYSMPIPGAPKLRLAGFYDVGNVWFDPYEFDLGHLAASAGLGLRLDIPGFPIRFDYAWPLEKDDPRSRTENWSFWIGYGF